LTNESSQRVCGGLIIVILIVCCSRKSLIDNCACCRARCSYVHKARVRCCPSRRLGVSRIDRPCRRSLPN
jgi:hypothetical protein